MHNDFLTSDNQEFVREVVQDKYSKFEPPVLSPDEFNKEWSPVLRRTGVIARKIGVYPLWLKNGKKISTTLLQVSLYYVFVIKIY